MTNQEAFTRVVLHLRRQGRQSSDGIAGCAYRSKDGLRCAIGVLITDEFYTEDMEGFCVADIRETLCSALPGVNFDLLRDLQDAHDKPNEQDDALGIWEKEWHHIALKHDLIVPTEPTEVNHVELERQQAEAAVCH